MIAERALPIAFALGLCHDARALNQREQSMFIIYLTSVIADCHWSFATCRAPCNTSILFFGTLDELEG